MTFPPDLPGILEYRLPTSLGDVVIYALPRRPVESISSSGKTTAVYVTPQIPLGAKGWRLARETAWRPMTTLPKSWLPFLERERPGPMDPRSALKSLAHDAIND